MIQVYMSRKQVVQIIVSDSKGCEISNDDLSRGAISRIDEGIFFS